MDKSKKEKEEKEEKKGKDLEEKYKRALADFQNLLKRHERERTEYVKYANEQILVEFITVYDHLKMSLDHIDEEAKDNPWVHGIRHVVKQFGSLLKANGIEEIKTMGEKFDHHTMEAVKGGGKKVKKEIKAGYKLNEKVIISARVILDN